MVIPRGKYSFQLYPTFAKLHGTSNDYKIQYKDFSKGFLLPKPDDIHVAYVLHLKTPLRYGNTLHHFIALQFEKEKKLKVALNISPE
jgi:structure-specific recognition protein 1